MKFEGIGNPWVPNAIKHCCPFRNVQGTACWGGQDGATSEEKLFFKKKVFFGSVYVFEHFLFQKFGSLLPYQQWLAAGNGQGNRPKTALPCPQTSSNCKYTKIILTFIVRISELPHYCLRVIKNLLVGVTNQYWLTSK